MSIITLKQKRTVITSVFGEGMVSSNGKDIAVYCPICKKSPKAKKKKKLSICIETGVYHCWVCEAKGKSLYRFVRSNFPNFKDLEKVGDYFGGKRQQEEEIVKKTLALPQDFKLIATSESITASYMKDYLVSRGMCKEDFYTYKAGYSFEAGFENRVIFPSFDKDLNLNFYVTRTCDDFIKFGKYRNCDSSKKDIVFNENLINWNETVIIVEGIFDAVRSGKNSIPILGSWIDKNYLVFRRIVENKTPVLLALDPDVSHKELKIAESLYEYGIEVRILQNKEKDLGDMTSLEFKNLVSCAKRFDNMERMRYLISGIKSGSMY